MTGTKKSGSGGAAFFSSFFLEVVKALPTTYPTTTRLATRAILNFLLMLRIIYRPRP